MKTYINVSTYVRKNNIKNLNYIYDLYAERIKPIFANAEQEGEEESARAWEEFGARPYVEGGREMEDFVDDCQEIGYEKYEIINLMQYRELLNWICCMCQVWEQQCYKLIIDESYHENIEYDDEFKGKGFEFIKDMFNIHGFNLEKMSMWCKISELRDLVNITKHGQGRAEKRLRKKRPDLFIDKDSNIDLLRLYNTSLCEPTLQVTTNDFEDYKKALCEFWEKIPEELVMPETELKKFLEIL